MLFVGNYYNEEQTDKATYTHPETDETISMPYTKDEILWPALYGVLTPVCIEVSDGIKILHSTSDILSIVQSNDQIEITLYGDRDLAGEIVYEGANVEKIKSATLNGENVKMVRDGKRVAFVYNHKHRMEMILNIRIE
jgi:hypothetical protein